MSTMVTRLPWFSSSMVFEYQLVINSRRPPMSSSSLASAEVVIPWGHHRREVASTSFQRNPHSTACPGTGARTACRFRWASTPSMPTRRPSSSSTARMSSRFSDVRRRWMLDRMSPLTGPT
jgi:hypothetical protein